MKIFTRDYRITGEYPEPFAHYFRDMKPCILDIETTGLDPSRSKVCLCALLVRTDTGVRITQFLAENHYEENRVLDATLDFLRDEEIDYLITYNGRAFDLPFINSRLERTFMERSIRMFDFDLYRFVSRCGDLRKRLPSLRQKAVEDYYGICSDRNDTISGRESIALFDQYSLTGDTVIEKIILTHNREDVLQLHRLMFLVLADTDEAESSLAKCGIPVLGGKYSARPHISVSGKMLKISGDQFVSPVSAAYFPDEDSPLTIVFNAASSSYEIDVPLGRLEDDFYADTESLGIDFADDPDCVNGFLILGPRTLNELSLRVAEKVMLSIPCF